MKVLICDDDASTRFAVTRLLTRHFDCTVVECSNGADAIARLDTETVNLVMLDIEMPELSGVDVLTAIRQSPSTRTLPVVMMSRERREEVVRTLLRLGIEGYVLKPLRADRVLAALDPLRDRLARQPSPAPGAAATGAPAMIVDGDADYRRLFVEHAQMLGSVLEADSGSAALALYRRESAAVVFVGEQLGFLSREQLVPKLRAMAASGPVRVIALSSPDADGATGTEGCDGALTRSTDGAALRAGLRRYAMLPVRPGSPTVMVGDVEACVVESGQQICAMMLDVAVAVAARSMSDAGACVIGTAMLSGPTSLSVSLAASQQSAKWIASRMFGKAPDVATPEDCDTVVGELCQLLSLRLKDWLETRALTCECGAPVVRRGPTPWADEQSELAALRVAFDVPGRGITVWVAIDPVT